ncbi:MAG: glycosyltransferase family 2 protein [Myxococcota bacterium]
MFLFSTIAASIGAVLALRMLLWARYRPTAVHSEDAKPLLTVVIPAFNEGPMVRRAIDSVLASDYPQDRLHLIVVDDGSTDDTAHHIRCAAVGERVTVLTLPQNRGKRHALYAGFTAAHARGAEVVATVDSDSIVPPDSLAALVAPLANRPGVAAVAGKVTAHNRGQNLLTRMLGVRYILGFDFIRAYQSVLKTVWCCPGALQAYRVSVIAPHLEAWRDQRFLGAHCTNGDDHAMTNLVLSLGHDAVYQSTALVETIVPSTYAGLCKMYIRWGRSATREGLRALHYAPARAMRLGPLVGTLVLLDALLQPLTVLARVVTLAIVVTVGTLHPWGLMQALVVTTGIALLYGVIFLRSERSWDAGFALLYAWFALLALPWVQPFATLTVRRNGWMTRA